MNNPWRIVVFALSLLFLTPIILIGMRMYYDSRYVDSAELAHPSTCRYKTQGEMMNKEDVTKEVEPVPCKCGGKSEVEMGLYDNQWYVFCTRSQDELKGQTCWISPSRPTKLEAIIAWNKVMQNQGG